MPRAGAGCTAPARASRCASGARAAPTPTTRAWCTIPGASSRRGALPTKESALSNSPDERSTARRRVVAGIGVIGAAIAGAWMGAARRSGTGLLQRHLVRRLPGAPRGVGRAPAAAARPRAAGRRADRCRSGRGRRPAARRAALPRGRPVAGLRRTGRPAPPCGRSALARRRAARGVDRRRRSSVRFVDGAPSDDQLVAWLGKEGTR